MQNMQKRFFRLLREIQFTFAQAVTHASTVLLRIFFFVLQFFSLFVFLISGSVQLDMGLQAADICHL